MLSASPSTPNSCAKAPRSPISTTHQERSSVRSRADRASAVLSLYSHLPGGKITTDIETAELVKYVDNTWHALKVAFTNEIAVVASTLGYRQRRGDEHFRRGQPAQHFQGLYAARLCLWRLMLAEGPAGARLPCSDSRSVAAGHQPHPRQQPDADRSRARLDSGAFQEARCLSRDQLQVRNGRRARKPVCELSSRA